VRYTPSHRPWVLSLLALSVAAMTGAFALSRRRR
jgi:hypothetical protein